MGLCNRVTGLCECRTGFEGVACERQSCPSQCYGVGECQSMHYFALSKDSGTGDVYKYESQWDAHKIYGCNCDSQYHGTDCSLRYCPKGDDPLTGTTEISATNPLQFNEIQVVTCRADGGTFTLTFRGKTTERIPFNAKTSELQSYIEALPTLGPGTTKIITSGGQACVDNKDGTTWTVEFLQDFGSLPLLVPDMRNLLYANALAGKLLTVAKQVDGTKENLDCSNRGICDTSNGVCSCSADFDTSNGYNAEGTRGDCGFATQSIQYCPGEITCSAHGACQNTPTYQCVCSDGWAGADCSERLCPSGLNWFTLPESDNVAHISTYSECSNAGVCDRSTGTCVCNTGFTGSSCNRLACPGESSLTEACGGHGQCLDMSSLAALSTVNGVLAGYSYGNIPNNPITWDATRVYGCLCDPQYTGYDCSLLTCPYGDDPDTLGQSDEQQIVSCTFVGGVDAQVVLKFREQLTASLSPLSTTAQVKAALESLSSITEVTVDIYKANGLDRLCTADGNQFLVTFLTEHGDLPDIQYVTQGITQFDTKEYIKGNKENIECSGRGLCDHTIGECACFTGFGSSDGKSGSGTKRDCGFLEPIASMSG
eukprot:CAMPEP_0170078820 /NCGR_PEP_ID=MMETSP0019_2-20121128/15355_1 /TAXON_ID=98059 /ORGANISM="Dinobryon sp., Strain UTEXLB2267" /LENGTH=596 /DNA_ID=CAMNT_0010291967 /DNA_START=226 /DNA_END=2016 /DNA_ORIENTATION=-